MAKKTARQLLKQLNKNPEKFGSTKAKIKEIDKIMKKTEGGQ